MKKRMIQRGPGSPCYYFRVTAAQPIPAGSDLEWADQGKLLVAAAQPGSKIAGRIPPIYRTPFVKGSVFYMLKT